MPIFGLLAGNNLSELETAARPVQFSNGEMLFLQEDPSDAVYKIVSGAAKLDRLMPDGRRQVSGFALPGYFLGISMYPRRNFGAQALGNVKALRFDLAAFKRFVLNTPTLLQDLFDLASRELDAAHELSISLARKTAEERVIWFLAEFRQRWERINGQSDFIPLPMTRTDIADHLSLTIETVSRSLSKSAQDKVIAIEHRGVRVLDQKRFAFLARPSLERFEAGSAERIVT
jgi:CRP/FNR family transcriptional regulator, anaerobic regulatory protein